MTKFSENIKVLFFLIFTFLFFLIAYLNQERLRYKRLKSPAYKCAIISKISKANRGRRSINYIFYLNGEYVKRIKGLDKGELRHCTPDNPWCVGKVYKVIYEKGNYKNSDLLLDDSCDDLIKKDTAIKWLLDIEYYKPNGKFWKDQHKGS
jgi:hypothetical protein